MENINLKLISFSLILFLFGKVVLKYYLPDVGVIILIIGLIGIILFYSIRYFNKTNVTFKDSLKLGTIVSWFLFKIFSELKFPDLKYLLYVFLISGFLLLIIELRDRFSTKKDKNLMSNLHLISLIPFMIMVIYLYFHLPGTVVWIIFSYVGFFIIAIDLLRIKATSSDIN